jgi:hypothetical protein
MHVVFGYPSNSNRSNANVEIDEFCPHCKMPMSPKFIYAIASDLYDVEKNSVCVLLQCSRSSCQKFFALEFPFLKRNGNSFIEHVYPAVKYTYSPHLENTLPPNLNEAFPDFKKIYDQALEAESMGLDEIAGVGYRKAIEFLIKRYVINQHPEKSHDIESKFLGRVIQDDLEDMSKIQDLAKAAVWIGNDETHFTRIHEDKDLRDMKGFLEAAALFISANLKADEAKDFTKPKES